MDTKIYIDAGHGGYDNGATYNGRKEKDDNLKLALAVGDALRKKGIDTDFTREKDVYQSPSEKAQMANEGDADLFISFHRSSSPVPNTNGGVEAYVYDTGGINEQLAKNINANLEKIGFKNNGVRVNKNLTILKKTNMPAVLLDIGYVNTDQDNRDFDTKFDQIVNAISDAIIGVVDNEDQQQEEDTPDYAIQVGLFKNQANAASLIDDLQTEGYDAELEPMGGYYAVIIGRYSSIAAAEKEEEKIQNMGYETIVIER
ncbi:MAG: N-acetylmuramoyl-L-alanine amidase [bacterium]|nr:N-acetylmuramoyl-L-alanine amidase [bacterium]